VVKSKEYVEDSELNEEVGQVPEGKIEEEDELIPVDVEEQPKKKQKVDARPINDGVLPPEGSKMWKDLLVCDQCLEKGLEGEDCIVLGNSYSCEPCRKWKERCSRVPPQWSKLLRCRLTEREEITWKVCGIEPSPSVPVKKASRRAARKAIERPSPPSQIFGPRSLQLGLKKSQKTGEEGQRDLSVINEVHDCLVH
jgi:hypothetical protein